MPGRIVRATLCAAAVTLGLLFAHAARAHAQPYYEDDYAGPTAARLDYNASKDRYGNQQFSGVHLAIARNGIKVFDRTFRPICRYCLVYPVGDVFDGQSSVRVLDLDGDGEPEVIVNFYWGGAHCCFYSYVAYHRPSGLYVLKRKLWGNLSYALRDLNHDGLAEFRTRDDRFSYALSTSFADSLSPLQVWNFRRGSFVDTTRRYRAALRADARSLWAHYRHYRHAGRETADVLAAYLADTYSLGRGASGRKRVRRAVRTGGLTSCRYCTHHKPASYLRALDRFMRRTGYSR